MKLTLIATAALAALTVAACATEQQRIASRENMLAAAGFTVLPANTAQRVTELATLPTAKFVMRTGRDGQTEYVFADPVDCNCLYIGNQTAYNNFRHEMFEQHLADEAQMTAMMYQDRWDWNRWNWGPWGPGWWS